jgi:hypothetical protein
MSKHNHITRDIKPLGECPACDLYHNRNIPKKETELSLLQSKYDELLKNSVELAEQYCEAMAKIDSDKTEYWNNGGKRARDFLKKVRGE